MLWDDVVFPTVAQVEMAHAESLRVAGGGAGIRDAGLLQSATLAPQNGYYSSLAELAAVLVDGIANNHPFIDGNKRTAFYTGRAFLIANGVNVAFDSKEWEAIMLGVAAGTVSRDQLTDHFTQTMGGNPVHVK